MYDAPAVKTCSDLNKSGLVLSQLSRQRTASHWGTERPGRQSLNRCLSVPEWRQDHTRKLHWQREVVINKQTILPYTDLSFLLQEGFAPPEDDEIDEGARGDQDEFWAPPPLLSITISLYPSLLSPCNLPDHYPHLPPLSFFPLLFYFLQSPLTSPMLSVAVHIHDDFVVQPSFPDSY